MRGRFMLIILESVTGSHALNPTTDAKNNETPTISLLNSTDLYFFPIVPSVEIFKGVSGKSALVNSISLVIARF